MTDYLRREKIEELIDERLLYAERIFSSEEKARAAEQASFSTEQWLRAAASLLKKEGHDNPWLAIKNHYSEKGYGLSPCAAVPYRSLVERDD